MNRQQPNQGDLEQKKPNNIRHLVKKFLRKPLVLKVLVFCSRILLRWFLEGDKGLLDEAQREDQTP